MPAIRLIGRDEELDLARSLLAPPSAGVVLAGQAGVGKTRLAFELARQVEADGRTLYRSVATPEGATVPFGLFSHLFDGLENQDRSSAMRSMAATLQGQKHDGLPPVLLIDDAQWADEASAVAVLRFAESGIATVILTLRSGEPTSASVTTLWKDEYATRIDLQPLSFAETHAMVEAITDAKVDETSARRVWALSHGNPLFVREVLRSAMLTTQPANGSWVWREAVHPDERLIDLVASHLRHIDPEARDVLALLAVGEPLTIETVHSLVGEQPLERAERSDAVTIDLDAGTVALSHPLFGEVIRSTESQLSLRSWRRVLAKELVLRSAPVRPGHPENDPMRQALWLLELDDGGPTPSLADPALREATGRRVSLGAFKAMLLGDYDLAHRLAHEAYGRLGVEALPVALVAAQSASLTGRTDEALAILHRAESTPGQDMHRARVALEHVTTLLWSADDPDAAIEAAERWRVDLAPEWQQLIDASKASALFYRGDYKDAHAIVDELVYDGSPLARLHAFDTFGLMKVLEGEPEMIVELGAQLLPLALRPVEGFRIAVTWTMAAQFTALVMTGRSNEAERLADLAERTNPFADDGVRAILAGSRGFIELGRGHAAESLEWLDRSVALGRASRRHWRGVLTEVAYAEALGLAGHGSDARNVMSAVTERVPRRLAYVRPYLMRAEAWVRHATGDLEGARTRAAEASSWCEAHGFDGLELVCRHQEVRFGTRGAVLARLDQLARRRSDPLALALAKAAGGLRRGDGSELDAATRDLAELSFDLLAAETASWAAEQHRRLGDLSAAAVSDARSRELAARCEGARSPALLATTTTPGVALTKREQQIVALAASGATNKAIAEELHVSVRTVEGHLLRAFAKLGVTDRAELRGRFASDRS